MPVTEHLLALIALAAVSKTEEIEVLCKYHNVWWERTMSNATSTT